MKLDAIIYIISITVICLMVASIAYSIYQNKKLKKTSPLPKEKINLHKLTATFHFDNEKYTSINYGEYYPNNMYVKQSSPYKIFINNLEFWNKIGFMETDGKLIPIAQCKKIEYKIEDYFEGDPKNETENTNETRPISDNESTTK